MKKRSKTLWEEWKEVGEAVRELKLVVAKSLGIIRLLDWLEKRLNRRKTGKKSARGERVRNGKRIRKD